MSPQANAKISPTGGPARAALVAKAAAGDRDAFATLYNEHRREVYRYLYRRTSNRALAEDLTSETFVRALKRIDTFTERPNSGGFGGWLCTIARNLYADHCKLSRTLHEVPIADVGAYESLDLAASAETDALRGLNAVEASMTIRSAMAKLTPKQRRCIQLRYLDELSIDQTCVALGRSEGAVKTMSFRAIRSMRRVLTEVAA
ncbi:sigma-70 family RNA polymerase sigma factor [Streptomyces sp. NPDC026665]|uniref:RNA polymerase sigma factor n=1 Tax=Streptomyces sp. NPDC026665 TaxID=3154798 RepID=UPI0033D317AB